MSLLIVGIGGLACLFAARLAEAGIDIVMMGSWPEGLAALRQHGVTLHDLDGSTRNFRVKVIEGPGRDVDYPQALVLVKSWQTERAAVQLKSSLASDGTALTLQNGLGNAEILKQSLGGERVVFGVTMLGARMLDPGHVQFTGNGMVYLGVHPRIGEFATIFQAAGFQVEEVQNPASLLWGKLVINAAINPLTALLRVANGSLLEQASTRELMAAAAQEAAMVAERKGITLPFPNPVIAAEGVARGTSANYSSMLQDVLRGTATEIDAINGAIVREGARVGVPTPVNRVLWQLVKSLDTNKGRDGYAGGG